MRSLALGSREMSAESSFECRWRRGNPCLPTSFEDHVRIEARHGFLRATTTRLRGGLSGASRITASVATREQEGADGKRAEKARMVTSRTSGEYVRCRVCGQ